MTKKSFVDEFNVTSINDKINKSITESIQSYFPIKGTKKTIELEDMYRLKSEMAEDDFPDQKEAKILGKSWDYPIYADLKLTDNDTGKIVDKARIKIGSIPQMTNRFSMIIDGNEYQTINQFRLKPGIYTRVQNNGQLVSQFNLEKGYNFKMDLDPEKRVFYLTLANKHFELYGILKALGMPESNILKAWGKEIYDKNVQVTSGKQEKLVVDLYKQLTRKEAPYDKALEGLNEYLDSTKVSPDTTKITLGMAFEKISSKTLLETSKKILRVRRGEDEPDQRDSLAFKDLYGVDDLLKTYFENKAPFIVSKLSRSADNKSNLKEIISSKEYGDAIKTFFTQENLSSTSPQTNPLEMLHEWRKTTIMGVGGIQSRHAITEDARDLHPSHINFLDPIATPDSGKVGITLPLSVEVRKENKNIKTPLLKSGIMLDEKNRSTSYEDKTSTEMWNLKVGFPDQYKIVNGRVKAKGSTIKGYYKGKHKIFTPSEVDYFIVSPSSLYSYTSNLVPFLANTQGNRASMGSRMMTQAVSLKNREKPLVQVESTIPGKTWEAITGAFLQPIAKESGEVVKVDEDYIHVKNKDGEISKSGLYNYFPLNQNSYLHSTPKVVVGDKVKKNELLATHNFSVDEDLAVGSNATVAYMPWKGYNFEDGVVATESFADKFTSSSMVKKNIFLSRESILDKNKFKTIFPEKLTPDNFKKLDNDGIIKEGEKINPGDILASYMEPRDMTFNEQLLKKMNKTSHIPYVDKSLEWTQSTTGVVKYVKKVGRNINIWILVESPMVVGDKISGRYGNKGIITKIIPDHEAPHNKDGKQVDLLMSPAGVPGRINPSQLLETAAGKWAKKTGNTYVVKNFSGDDILADIEKKLKAEKIEINETLLDGKDGKPFENKIFTGEQYILRLMHDVDKKHKARERGSYDDNLQPSAGKTGGQSIDPMTMYAMVAHGATKNLRDATLIKGQKNEEIWQALQLGLPIPTPKSNFVWDKMMAYLQNSGVNIKKNGNYLITSPFTDKDLKKISSGALSDAGEALRGKNLAPIKGGLFDPELVGGLNGNKWSHIKLNMKMPHPIFETAIIKITGLTKPKFDAIMDETHSEDGITGAKLIQKKLGEINLTSALRRTKEELKTAPKSKINLLNKKYKHLKALKDFKISPTELMISNFPVMPSKFRPVYALPSGDLTVPGINHHYRSLAQVTNQLKASKDLGFDDEMTISSRRDLYRILKETVGVVEPLYQMKKHQGAVKYLAGTSPKTGFIQSRAWSKRQDVSGRSTVTVDPELGLDEAGIPVDMAKTIYRPFIIKEMKQAGYDFTSALKEINSDSNISRNFLLNAMEKRPILLNRAPTLHKHGIQAFKPVLVDGKDIKTNPLINAGFNLDYDGDTMAVHVPITPDAVDEAWGMLPSKNVFKAGDNTVVHEISKDYQLGLYFLTVPGKDTKRRFNTVLQAEQAGLNPTDVFSLKGKKTTIGIQLVNSTIPTKYRDYDNPFSGRKVKILLNTIAKETPGDFDTVISSLKDLGNRYGHLRGSSISINDLKIDQTIKNDILKKIEQSLGPRATEQKRIDAYKKAKDEVKKAIHARYKDSNKFYEWIDSGALGKEEGVVQMIGMPGILEDTKGRAIPIPITKSYAEGLDSFDYFNSIYGVRKGTVDRAVNTQDSGELNKRLLANTRKLLILEEDCKTLDGLEFKTNDKNILDRTAAHDIKDIVEAGQFITQDIQLKLKKAKIESIIVRSPLTCEVSQGVCQKCYGLLPGGQLPPIGTNVGILDGQAISERSTQLTMRTFHTGGAAGTGGGVTAGFNRLDQLFKVPATLPNKATLSEINGKVKSIETSPVGGKDINIDGMNHYVPPNLEPVVKINQFMNKGDKISTGSIKPQELAELKSFRDAQRQIIDELDDIYENKFFKKTFETAIRGVSDNAEILESGDSNLLPGDRTSTSLLKQKNKELIANDRKPIKYKEYFKSIAMLTDDGQDWLDRLSSVHLGQTIKDMASTQMASNIHGNNPLPAYIYGLEFADDKQKGPY